MQHVDTRQQQARRQAELDVLLQILKPTNENITGRINAFDKNWRQWQARPRGSGAG